MLAYLLYSPYLGNAAKKNPLDAGSQGHYRHRTLHACSKKTYLYGSRFFFESYELNIAAVHLQVRTALFKSGVNSFKQCLHAYYKLMVSRGASPRRALIIRV